VGNVSVHGSNCLFSITNIRDMQNVLLPLLDNYNIFTTKGLDYLDFKLVLILYLAVATLKGKRPFVQNPQQRRMY
jgi:LAGLIDADG endonuclease